MVICIFLSKIQLTSFAQATYFCLTFENCWRKQMSNFSTCVLSLREIHVLLFIEAHFLPHTQ